jgi:hypothetical protein
LSFLSNYLCGNLAKNLKIRGYPQNPENQGLQKHIIATVISAIYEPPRGKEVDKVDTLLDSIHILIIYNRSVNRFRIRALYIDSLIQFHACTSRAYTIAEHRARWSFPLHYHLGHVPGNPFQSNVFS